MPDVDDEDRDELAELFDEASRRDPSFKSAYQDVVLRQAVLSRLVAIRKALVITQKVVAERMQTTQSAVSDLENGATDPYLSTLQRYARAVTARLDISVTMPHDSPWCEAGSYAHQTASTKLNTDAPPRPTDSQDRHWRSAAVNSGSTARVNRQTTHLQGAL